MFICQLLTHVLYIPLYREFCHPSGYFLSSCGVLTSVPLSFESFHPFQEDSHPPDVEKEEPAVASVVKENKSTDNFQERRASAISAKALEIEKVQTVQN